MAKTEMIRARIEPELKQEAEKVFFTLGLSVTEAITLFYKQVTLHHGLPFGVKIPNEETLEAIRQARSGEGLITYGSVDELMAEFDDA
ncbi:MAG: type II toxin-antitoxin system RelB/DinJ family antitoxin [Candidatus Dadabacteria bacterium]|nr:type II toxin-antitoxin system RelB/DinJ family antitoxin [Candidatus Dadabacteria bacterium]